MHYDFFNKTNLQANSHRSQLSQRQTAMVPTAPVITVVSDMTVTSYNSVKNDTHSPIITLSIVRLSPVLMLSITMPVTSHNHVLSLFCQMISP